MSLIVFILVLSVLIVVHEWGHFIMARKLGVKVERFSVGFGKKIFSRMHKGTEFMICAIPLGGYIKMAGDERGECKGAPEEFFSHPLGHRALIVLMGPIVNFLFAYLCFYFIFATGFPTMSSQIGKVMEGFPAQAAGLGVNDRILKIDSQKITNWDELHKYVLNSGGRTMNFSVERAGQTLSAAITPRQKILKNFFGQEESVWLVGIEPAGETIFLRYGPLESFFKAGEHLWDVTTTTFKALYYVITGAMPAQDAFAGPIRIFDVVKDAMRMGVAYLLDIMAVISASLAIFNLFPIPVLDGGHLFFLGIEKIRRRPLPARVEEGLTRVGFSLLMCLMLFVFYNDIVQSGRMEHVIAFFQKFRP